MNALSLFIIGYGVFGLAYAVLAFPVMWERSRRRKKDFNTFVDMTMIKFIGDLQSLPPDSPFRKP